MENAEKYNALKLENQICFPLYAASREIIKKYRPFLDEIGLTYTQYIAMMVLWEEKSINVKTLGEKLFLDSGTLSPVLKSLEDKGFVSKLRDKNDERSVTVNLTEKGERLKERAAEIPSKIVKCVSLPPDDALHLYTLLYKLLATVKE
ncbi:MAG: MarR family transcriptional regulator [Clostridia bacterium]|nr:MarR family transcriptional regulator [Clostridia bacterium]